MHTGFEEKSAVCRGERRDVFMSAGGKGTATRSGRRGAWQGWHRPRPGFERSPETGTEQEDGGKFEANVPEQEIRFERGR